MRSNLSNSPRDQLIKFVNNPRCFNCYVLREQQLRRSWTPKAPLKVKNRRCTQFSDLSNGISIKEIIKQCNVGWLMCCVMRKACKCFHCEYDYKPLKFHKLSIPCFCDCATRKASIKTLKKSKVCSINLNTIYSHVRLIGARCVGRGGLSHPSPHKNTIGFLLLLLSKAIYNYQTHREDG